MTNQAKELSQHPFERTLGVGPYKFVGFFALSLDNNALGRPICDKSLVHANFKAGAGTCAHCGHAILNIYQIQIGNGDVFGVGSDCIEKVNMPAKELSLVKKAKKDHDKALRSAREELKQAKLYAEALALIESSKESLAAIAHPSAYFASQGKSLLDWANFVIKPKVSSSSLANAINTLTVSLSKLKGAL